MRKSENVKKDLDAERAKVEEEQQAREKLLATVATMKAERNSLLVPAAEGDAKARRTAQQLRTEISARTGTIEDSAVIIDQRQKRVAALMRRLPIPLPCKEADTINHRR